MIKIFAKRLVSQLKWATPYVQGRAYSKLSSDQLKICSFHPSLLSVCLRYSRIGYTVVQEDRGSLRFLSP